MTSAHPDRLARLYEEHHRAGNRAGFTFGGGTKGRLFARWIGTGNRVLDLGCRDGTLTGYFTSGNQVVGVDVDRRALTACQERLGIETLWWDLSVALPFETGAFNVVVASEVLEHLPFPHTVVAEAARLIRRDGLFLGSVPNAFRLKNRLVYLLGRDPDSDPTHLRRFSVPSLRHLLGGHFREVQIRPAFGRLARLHGGLFANSLLWRCRKA